MDTNIPQNFVKHHQVKKALVLMVVELLIAGGMGAFIVSSLNAAPAKALVGMPYGGFITSSALVPNPTPAGIPDPACPAYSIVTNSDPTDGLPPVYGIFIPPLLPLPTYDYNNLFTSGTPVLGELVFTPCPGGTAPIFLYPLFPSVDEPFYLTGTGLF